MRHHRLLTLMIPENLALIKFVRTCGYNHLEDLCCGQITLWPVLPIQHLTGFRDISLLPLHTPKHHTTTTQELQATTNLKLRTMHGLLQIASRARQTIKIKLPKHLFRTPTPLDPSSPTAPTHFQKSSLAPPYSAPANKHKESSLQT